MASVLDLLRECKWRGIAFPISSLRTTLKQDLVEHKYWGQDGARLESTGQAPLTIEVVIPFRNGLAKAKSETWASLYPNTFRFFLLACSDRSIGIFDHPELGEIACKLSSADTVWDPNRRDGVDVHATFVQANVQNDTSSPLADPSPAAGAQQSGFDLDAAITTLKPPLPTTPVYKANFADSIRSVLAVGDQVSLLQKQVGGKFSELAYRAQQIENSALSAKSALMWPIIVACERIKHVANSSPRGKFLQQQREVSYYVVPARTTLAGLVGDIPEASIGDLIKLNPTLPANPSVLANTVVRYYTPKAKR